VLPDRSTVTDGERLNLHAQQQSKQRAALPPPQVLLQNGSSGADRDVLKKPEGGAETSMYRCSRDYGGYVHVHWQT
jgi:hypothetical protein